MDNYQLPVNSINNYVVSFESSVQCTEDHWEMKRYCLQVDSNTTIKEIELWLLNKTNDEKIVDFQIHKLETK